MASKILETAMKVGVTLAIPGAYVRYQESDIKGMQNVLQVKDESFPQKLAKLATIGDGQKTNLKVRPDFLSLRLEANFNDQAEGMKGEVSKTIAKIKEIG